MLFIFCFRSTVMSVSCSLEANRRELAGLLALLVDDVFLCFCHFFIQFPRSGYGT